MHDSLPLRRYRHSWQEIFTSSETQVTPVPTEDRHLWSIPDWSHVIDRLQRANLSHPVPPPEYQAEREEILQVACRYTAWLRGCSYHELWDKFQSCLSAPWIITGHQPTLFHPGVWAKNFAAYRLAAMLGGLSLHIVVDHDLMLRPDVITPSGNFPMIRPSYAAFDQMSTPKPWELASIQAPSQWKSFDSIITERMREYGWHPLVYPSWSSAVIARDDILYYRDGFGALRETVQNQWGVNQLQLCVSDYCTTQSFYRILGTLLSRLPELHTAYNSAIVAYRQRHRTRSRHHPAPLLKRSGAFYEIPWWHIHKENHQRLAVWATLSGTTCQLYVPELAMSCHLHDLTNPTHIQQAIEDAALKLRPRALSLTFMMRWRLAELFVHGLGGVLYDQVTDDWAERMRIPLAPWCGISATVWLPWQFPLPTSWLNLEQIKAQLAHMRWRLSHHPERYLDLEQESQTIKNLVAQKRELIQDEWPSDPHARHTRYRKIKEINEKLAQLTIRQQETLQQQLKVVQAQLESRRWVTYREYPWILYPEESLLEFYRQHLGDWSSADS